MIRFLKAFITLSFFLFAAAVVLYSWGTNYYKRPNNLTEESIVYIESGANIKSIANYLDKHDIINYPDVFFAIAKITEQTNPKLGEYEFEPGISPKQILEKLENGDVISRKFTIPEGKTSYEILQILSEVEFLEGEAPKELAEGSILPSTYLYHRGDKYQSLITVMQDSLKEELKKEWENRAENLPITTPEEAVILASIVEKETGLDGERGLVASVFTNRLNKGMRLESDPTAIYGITKGKPLGRKVLAKDMKDKSEYNTYVIDRLPPTPICAPGIEAIRAVLNPPQTDYFYFVANGQGGHNFGRTLAEHNANVSHYRKVMAGK